MTQSLEKILNDKLHDIFTSLKLDTRFAFVKTSDRPDLSDYQCNGVLALAKTAHQNPRDIAFQIARILEKDRDIASVSVDGPGFINIGLSDIFLAKQTDALSGDDRLGVGVVESPRQIVMDFGGPNVAKALHVGHLRSAVIGEALRRLEKFIGNTPVSDVHFGDWGTPMGMILSEIIRQDGDLSKTETYDIEAISTFYKKANARCKEDEAAKEEARRITALLQAGDTTYRKAWQHLRNVSVTAVKAQYDELSAHFDLWLGESDADKASREVIEIARQKGISEVDDGATIIRLPQSNKPMPPVILVKSDGGIGYQVTDIATIKMRVDDLNAQEILYVVDKRQNLHFEQVFQAAKMLGIASDAMLKHIGFGTVNGADGKPFKTRDGGVMNLEDLILLSKGKVRRSMPKPHEVEGYGEQEIEKLVTQIAIGAIKFQDLKNNIAAGYVFDLDDFANFEGKTGPYIQYAVARINSILRKAAALGLREGNVCLKAVDERILVLKLFQMENVVFRAEADKEPSIIADYAYTLAQTFSSFYNTCPIMNAESPAFSSSRLRLARMVRDALKLLLYLLGIEAPEVMLKAKEEK